MADKQPSIWPWNYSEGEISQVTPKVHTLLFDWGSTSGSPFRHTPRLPAEQARQAMTPSAVHECITRIGLTCCLEFGPKRTLVTFV